jgi:hypothetical protein
MKLLILKLSVAVKFEMDFESRGVQTKLYTLWIQNMAGFIIWQYCEFCMFKEL